MAPKLFVVFPLEEEDDAYVYIIDFPVRSPLVTTAGGTSLPGTKICNPLLDRPVAL